jgi:hypothetical protein
VEAKRPNQKTPIIPADGFRELLAEFNEIINQAGKTYSLDDPDRQPPHWYFANYGSPEEACRKANEDAKEKAAKQFVQQYKRETTQRHKYIKRIEDRFSEYFLGRRGWLTEAMKKHERFKAMLIRTKFIAVMNYLWEITTPYKSTQELSKFVKGNPENLILFVVDTADMANKTNLSKSVVYRYIQGFVKFRVIKEVGKTDGKNPPKIYSFGKWVFWQGPKLPPRRNTYLTNSMIEEVSFFKV